MDSVNLNKSFKETVRQVLSKEELEKEGRKIHEVRSIPKSDLWTFESVGGFFMPTEEISKLPLDRQEQLLIRNLIYAFSGVPSSHIKPEATIKQIATMQQSGLPNVRFKIDEGFNSTIRTLGNYLLPLVGHFISVQNFIETTNMTPRSGRTSLALAAALNDKMQQYYDLQATMETEMQQRKLFLKDLVRQLRPWVGILKVFSSMVTSARGKKTSAQILSDINEIYEKLKPSDLELKELLEKILNSVSSVYMKIVQLWTQKGIIYDLQHEFFVEDSERSNSMSSTLLAPEQCCHAYWENRYTLLPERLPDFLNPLAAEIFHAGKYLNILRQCNVKLTLMQTPLNYNPKEQGHVEIIRSSYELPGKKLLDYLKTEHHLEWHLGNLHGYFLLQNQEFAEALLANYQEHMQRGVDRMIPETLQSLLMETLQIIDDPFKDLMRCQLKDRDVASQLQKLVNREHGEADKNEGNTSNTTSDDDGDPFGRFTLYGYEAFALRYEPKWPLSFVLHSEPLQKMQLLQRVILFLRYVQRQLQALWQAPPEGTIPISQSTRSEALRQRMLDIMINLEQYITQDIAEPRWEMLIVVADKAQHIDDLVERLSITLEECLRLGLLSGAIAFVRSLFTLGQVCLNFSSFAETPLSDEQAFDDGVAEYETEFDSLLKSILDLVRELANSTSSTAEDERESCQQLLLRLEAYN
ncbi:gamma-tubulin complex component 2 homolog [Drosophila pseudoobscura]|uniref:Gamma-tubulin complex component n=1 Tax=Drosophila pseudoobscura pseudoobscura TaxID=46245 RepID=A0A6I8UCC3_DROPS|nr:gamma-tubulin complex component 2 homolog [Drosophila pseudoobscura]